MSTPGEVRRGSRLGRQTATFVEQLRGQHNTRYDGEPLTVTGCVLVPEGEPTESQGYRATAESRWTLYVPRTLPETIRDAVVTVSPGPTDDKGAPLRLAAAPAQPYWKRNGQFSHAVVPLRYTVS